MYKYGRDRYGEFGCREEGNNGGGGCGTRTSGVAANCGGMNAESNHMTTCLLYYKVFGGVSKVVPGRLRQVAALLRLQPIVPSPIEAMLVRRATQV